MINPPRIGIPWYRAEGKISIFDEGNSPRNINFHSKKSNVPIAPEPIPEPVLVPVTEPVTSPVTRPVTEPVTSPVTEPVTSPVTRPVTEPVTSPVTEPVTRPVTNPVTEPVTKPFTEPLTNPVKRPTEIPVPKPILPPIPSRENNKRPVPVHSSLEEQVNKPLTVYQMLEKQKQSQINTINERHREMVQYDMLMQRDIAQRKIVNKNAQFSIKNLEGYKLYMQMENATPLEKLAMTKETRLRQITIFNESVGEVEKQLGGGKDIILDYISNNEITFGTLPNHYKEINKELAKAGVQGLALGAVAYILYQIAKVATIAI